MTTEVAERFDSFADRDDGLRSEVLGELLSMLSLHTLDAEELFCKWEAYVIKMHRDDMKLDMKTVKDFKKDVEDELDRQSRSKAHAQGNRKRPGATPRTAGKNADAFGM